MLSAPVFSALSAFDAGKPSARQTLVCQERVRHSGTLIAASVGTNRSQILQVAPRECPTGCLHPGSRVPKKGPDSVPGVSETPSFRNGPNTVSESTASNTELSEFFGAR